jgi:NADPH-dependent 2,4-dienoyl-CoA reductase/sulfur reductase-like enzyme
MERVVVVGGGIAGLEAVVALRSQGFHGSVTLVTAEPHRPYDKPPLSKEILTTEQSSTALPASWEALEVDIRFNSTATGLEEERLFTTTGEVHFDGLIIATGTTPIEIPVTAPAAAICYLRTIDDALGLRARLLAGARVVVVGAGWIGAEVATAAASRGCMVTVVEAMQSPLATALPAEIGMLTAGWYKEAGVDLLLGTRVADITHSAVELENGQRLEADVVVIGVGVRPETAWLEGSPVERDERGYIIVDDSMRTSASAVTAVGDCISWPSRRYDKRMRTGHWDHALRSPEFAVASLLGEQRIYDPVPYFWSDQLGRNVQYVGHWSSTDEVVLRGDPHSGPWSACWTNDGKLTAVLAVDRPRDISQARKILGECHRIDADKMDDPDLPLKNLIVVG